MAGKKILVRPASKYGEYISWKFDTGHSKFEFTYNTLTKLFSGARTGDNEYSGMSSMECRRVIGELGLVLEGLA